MEITGTYLDLVPDDVLWDGRRSPTHALAFPRYPLAA